MSKVVVINGIEYAPIEKDDVNIKLLEGYYEKELLKNIFNKNRVNSSRNNYKRKSF